MNSVPHRGTSPSRPAFARASWIGLVATLALVASASSAPAVAAAPEFLLGGIQVHERDHGRWVDALRGVGMNTVAVTVYARQGDWDGDELAFAEDEPSVLDEIRAARSRGLAVVLVLRVALDHAHPRNKFLWHGQIMPSSDDALRGWFERYGEFVRKWAVISQREGVAVLAIGSELKALTATRPIDRYGNWKTYYAFYWYQRLSRKRANKFADEIEQRHLWVRGFENYDELGDYLQDRFRHNIDWARQAQLRDGAHTLARVNARRQRIQRHWEELIASAREVYRGRLTYAANFDHYTNVGFWPSLDLVGINAYFSLRSGATRDLDDTEKREVFEQSWRQVLAGVESFKASQGLAEMPYLFTEIGYTFRRHSTVEPWAHDGFSVIGWGGHKRRLVVWGEQPIDYEERRLALAALHAAWLDTDRDLSGLLYWKLSTDPGHEAIEPFVLHVGADSEDPAQGALLEFLEEPSEGED